MPTISTGTETPEGTADAAGSGNAVPAGLLYLLATLVVLLDQAVKAWATARLEPVRTIDVIPGVFDLTYARNDGMAFSLLQGQRGFLVVAAFAVVIGIVWTQRRIGARVPVLLCYSLALALGGALGNALDRVRFGYVVDLFYFRLINFPIFNVADAAITCGVVLLAWHVAATPAPQEAA